MGMEKIDGKIASVKKKALGTLGEAPQGAARSRPIALRLNSNLHFFHSREGGHNASVRATSKDSKCGCACPHPEGTGPLHLSPEPSKFSWMFSRPCFLVVKRPLSALRYSGSHLPHSTAESPRTYRS